MDNIYLTQHFKLSEMIESETAREKGIDNFPKDNQVMSNLSTLAQLLEKVREVIGKPIKINSAYRCEALNNTVGGAKNSDHLKGMAADIKVAGMTPKQVCEAVMESGLNFGQLIHEFDSWTHISVGTKKEVLTIDKKGVRSGLDGGKK